MTAHLHSAQDLGLEQPAIPLALLRSAQGGPLVGRDGPLAELLMCWQEARDGLVLVTGEPGVGKTRLLAELGLAVARSGGRVLYGRCSPEPSGPFGPAVEALRSGADIHVLPAAHRLVLARLLPELEPDRAIPTLAEELGAALRQRLFDAIAATLALQPTAGRAVLILDDLHWADPSMLLLVADLARRDQEAGILLIGSCREPDPDLGVLFPIALQQMTAAARVSEIRLAGLGEADVIVAAQGWERHRLGPRLAAQLTELTKGNPFLLRSVLRHLLDTGQSLTEDRRVVTARARDLVAPDLRAIVGRQMQALGRAARELLQAGAVLGRDFQLEEAARIAGIPIEEAVTLADRAVEAGLLEQMSESLLLRFVHALLQEAVLASLSAGGLALVHLRAGEAIERAADRRARLTELASHFGAARDVGGAPRALEHARAAAQLATAQLAFAESAAMHEIALAALERLPDQDRWERYEQLIELGFARYRAMYRAQAQEAFTEAAQIAELEGDARRVARAALGVDLERYLAVSGTADPRATAPLELALRMLRDEDDPLRLRCQAALLFERCFVIGLQERDTELRALQAAAERTKDDELGLNVLTTRHVVLWHPAHTPELLGSVDDLIERARVSSRLDVAMHLHCTAFGYAAELGDRVALERHLAGALRAMGRTGAPIQRVRTAALEIVRMLLDGRLAEVPQVADRFRLDSDTIDPAMGLYVDTLWRFVLAREIGGLASVRPALEAIAAAVPKDPLVGAVLAETYARLGERVLAADRLAAVTSNDFQDIHEDFNWLGTLTAAATGTALLRAGQHAGPLLELLGPYAGRNGILGVAALDRPVAHAIGLLARLLDDMPRALECFERAARDARSFGAPLWEAGAQCELGMTLRRMGRPAQAREPLLRALDLAAAHGATVLAGQAREELRMTGARPRRARSTGLASLTTGELRVARLAAAGQTNAQIAGQLVLSLRTVETHLTTVYRKLGIDGRGQLEGVIHGELTQRPSVSSSHGDAAD